MAPQVLALLQVATTLESQPEYTNGLRVTNFQAQNTFDAYIDTMSVTILAQLRTVSSQVLGLRKDTVSETYQSAIFAVHFSGWCDAYLKVCLSLAFVFIISEQTLATAIGDVMQVHGMHACDRVTLVYIMHRLNSFYLQ